MIVSDVTGRDSFQHASETLLPPNITRQLTYSALYCPDITDIKVDYTLIHLYTPLFIFTRSSILQHPPTSSNILHHCHMPCR